MVRTSEVNFYFVVVVIILNSKSKTINLRKTNYVSDLAMDKKVSRPFNISLVIFAIGQTAFSLYASLIIAGDRSLLPVLLYLGAGVALVLCTIFTRGNSKHVKIHMWLAYSSALLVSLGSIILSIYVFKIYPTLGVATLIGAILIPVSRLFEKKFTGVAWEIILLAGILNVDICLTLTLILN